jgi:magnesium transporter
MSFAIVFQNKTKTCTRQGLDDLDIEKLNKSNFAWIHLDHADDKNLAELLERVGIPESKIDPFLDPSQFYYYAHTQHFILEHFHLCSLNNGSIESSSLKVAMTDRVIVTAHEGASGYIEQVLDICEESFKSVGKSPGFIYFLLWDTIVDGFLPIIFNIGDKLEEFVGQYLSDVKSDDVLSQIMQQRQEVRKLKRSLAPMQRSLRHLVSTKIGALTEESRLYLKGIFEHLDRIAQNIDSLQSQLNATIDGYNSKLSKQINNSMRILAIIATIMMPLSLIAAIYGTNFQNIPELQWKYSYYAFLGLLLAMAISLLLIFKRKRWL